MKKLYEVITAQESENDYQARVHSWNVIAVNVFEAMKQVQEKIDDTNNELAKDVDGEEIYTEYVDEVKLICINIEL